jgi:hypothetical protein
VKVNGVAFPAWTTINPGWTSWTPGIGYNQAMVTASASGSLNIVETSTTEQISALQIVPAPEPSTYALAAFGGLSLLVYRRRVSRVNHALATAQVR